MALPKLPPLAQSRGLSAVRLLRDVLIVGFSWCHKNKIWMKNDHFEPTWIAVSLVSSQPRGARREPVQEIIVHLVPSNPSCWSWNIYIYQLLCLSLSLRLLREVKMQENRTKSQKCAPTGWAVQSWWPSGGNPWHTSNKNQKFARLSYFTGAKSLLVHRKMSRLSFQPSILRALVAFRLLHWFGYGSKFNLVTQNRSTNTKVLNMSLWYPDFLIR